MWRDWFIFPRQDRRAICLLSLLIVVTLLILWAKPMWHAKQPYEAHVPDSLLQLLHTTPTDTAVVQVVPHNFNPNTADSLELLSVGFSPYVTRNLLRYRKAGGVFRQPDDVARIYGLHDTVFARIKPYIVLPPEKHAGYEPEERIMPDTLSSKRPNISHSHVNYKPGKFIDLNTADTTELIKIPGIGPVRAQKIVSYRRALGGYHTIAQVHEAYDLPEHLGDWVHISAPALEKIYINKVTLKQLHAHPYLNFYQARAIIELRKREGAIRTARQLLFLDEFTEADIIRLEPYLSFE